jgi:phospholipid transport system substrate-binding protein
MLVRTYATALRELGKWEVRFPALRSEAGDRNVLVQTQVVRAGSQPVAVDYRMYLKDGVWRAYDVMIEGVSLITNYRSSFARLIQTKGIGGLIEELARTNEEKDSSTREKLALGAPRPLGN